jgi:hypothetical protein
LHRRGLADAGEGTFAVEEGRVASLREARGGEWACGVISLFLDESGDHSLHKVDPQFPVFTLAGCAFDDSYYEARVVPEIVVLKHRLFGRSDIVLHTADITRNRNGFESLKMAEVREEFYRSLNEFLRALDFVVVAVSIRKNEHIRRRAEPADPYHLSLEVILERFYYLLQERNDHGRVIAESRNRLFDNDLRQEFDRLMSTKRSYVRAARLRSRIEGLEFRHKRENLAGLQIADLVATPVSRFVIGRRTHEDFSIIEQKFRRSPVGEYWGYGLKILP